MKEKLKIIPLGGLNEIGKNMTVIEYGGDIVVIDCGVAFPDDDMLGVDLVIPDTTYLKRNINKLRGYVITHGHEDHIGAIPYVLRECNAPIYATRLTCGIIETKLSEHRMPQKVKLNHVRAGDTIRLGCFRIEFIHTNHSIADSVALAITTPLGTILHTGDFKIDLTPVSGEMIDLVRIGELGKKGLLALMSDSTNVERPGYTPSEKIVGKSLEKFILESDQRIIIATFASNVSRLQQILDIVKDIIESGHAYVAKNGDVYFRVKSDPEYGKLSHLKLDDLESGNRELRSQMEDDLKEDPADFAVWKAAKPGEPAWESPYGMGRPGWHIECSAMSRTHLGKTIDLHCGGQDLIFPHHENEIAQSECANGCEFARYWMHNGFINVDNQKMSKSLHNFFTVRDVANLYGYEPIRYFMLTAGYRMPLNYTVDLIESCKNSLERLYTCRENLDFALSKTEFGTDETLKEKAEEAKKKFCTAMDDDLNTPDALAAVFDLVKDINTLSAASSKAALEAGAAAFDEITGVLGLMYNRKKDEVPAEVTELVEKRAAAKKAKDWAAADAIRAQLTEMGWAVKDTAQGPQLSKL